MQIVDAQIHTWGQGLPSNQSHWPVTHFTIGSQLSARWSGVIR